jgi:hypothetical protein
VLGTDSTVFELLGHKLLDGNNYMSRACVSCF